MALPGKKILYAEDDPNDVVIFKMGVKRAALSHEVYIVDDDEAAINWLAGKGKFQDRTQFPIPDVLILDLKMPRKTGFDVLQWVRANPTFSKMPVIILSSSDEPADLKRATALGATTYFVKSASFKELIQYLRVSI